MIAHQVGVLVQPQINPCSSQAALARPVLVRQQSVRPSFAQMTEQGLVGRKRPAARTTAARVELTEQGQSAVILTPAAVGVVNQPLALGLIGAGTTELNRMLHRVLHHLDGPVR